MIYVIMFFVSLCFVGSKAYQNLSIIHGNTKTVLMMGYVIASFEVAGIAVVSVEANSSGLAAAWLILPMGTAGGLGCLLSMILHKKMRGAGKS